MTRGVFSGNEDPLARTLALPRLSVRKKDVAKRMLQRMLHFASAWVLHTNGGTQAYIHTRVRVLLKTDAVSKKLLT